MLSGASCYMVTRFLVARRRSTHFVWPTVEHVCIPVPRINLSSQHNSKNKGWSRALPARLDIDLCTRVYLSRLEFALRPSRHEPNANDDKEHRYHYFWRTAVVQSFTGYYALGDRVGGATDRTARTGSVLVGHRSSTTSGSSYTPGAWCDRKGRPMGDEYCSETDILIAEAKKPGDTPLFFWLSSTQKLLSNSTLEPANFKVNDGREGRVNRSWIRGCRRLASDGRYIPGRRLGCVVDFMWRVRSFFFWLLLEFTY